jgi:hypothetical protein
MTIPCAEARACADATASQHCAHEIAFLGYRRCGRRSASGWLPRQRIPRASCSQGQFHNQARTVRTPEGRRGGEGAAGKGAAADYARNLSNTEKKAAEVSGLETLNKAVQQYQVIEGRFPRTLDELVASRYLPKLPPAPRGKRFVYDSKAGEVTVQDLPAAKPAETTPVATTEPAAEPTKESASAQQSASSPAPAAETLSESAK